MIFVLGVVKVAKKLSNIELFALQN